MPEKAIPEFDKVKSKVRDDWMNDKTERLQEDKLKELISKYKIRVESDQTNKN